MRPSWPAPTMPTRGLFMCQRERSAGASSALGDRADRVARARRPSALARYSSRVVAIAECLLARMDGGEQCGVDGAGLADRDACATGMPRGICTIDSNESMPLSARDRTGTPRRAVVSWPPSFLADGRRRRRPRSRLRARARRRCRRTRTTDRACDAPRRRGLRRGCRARSSVSVVCDIVDQSDTDPMMTPTNGFIGALYSS